MHQVAFYDFKEGWDHKSAKGPATKAFYLGHTLRFLAAIPGTIADLILQVAQVASLTLELLLVKAETKIRGVPFDDTRLGYLFYEEGICGTMGLLQLRTVTTQNEPGILATDLNMQHVNFNIVKPFFDRLTVVLFS